MSRYLLVALMAALLAVLQAGLGPLLPPAFALVSPVLALVLWLLMDSRLADALTAAFAAGLVADAVSSSPAGLMTIALVTTVLAGAVLFAHVFTNQALAAALGLQAAAFAVYQAIWAVFRLVRFVIFGQAWGEGILAPTDRFIVGLLVQLMVAALLVWSARRLRQWLTSALMVASRPAHS